VSTHDIVTLAANVPPVHYRDRKQLSCKLNDLHLYFAHVISENVARKDGRPSRKCVKEAGLSRVSRRICVSPSRSAISPALIIHYVRKSHLRNCKTPQLSPQQREDNNNSSKKKNRRDIIITMNTYVGMMTH
jgi:hypothetical protein